MKKSRAILLTINEKFVFAAGTLIQNINYISPGLVDNYIIYHDGLSESSRNALINLDSRVCLKSYSIDDWAQDIGIESIHKERSEHAVKLKKAVERFSLSPLVRWKVFEELKEYKKILYLDVDVLIRQDISPLFNHEGFLWRQTAHKLGQRFTKDFLDSDIIKDVDPSASVPNGGMIMVSDQSPYEEMLSFSKKIFRKYIFNMTHAFDEIIFSWLASKYNVPLKLVNGRVYNATPGNVTLDTALIHTLGPYKIWNDFELNCFFYDWNVHYRKWISSGGVSSPFQLERRDGYSEFQPGKIINKRAGGEHPIR